jgi:hypothetical protein
MHVLASLVGPLCSPPDRESEELARIDLSELQQVRELVRRTVLPDFLEFDDESQKKMRDSLEYYLGVENSGIERIFPAFHIPLQPAEAARGFFFMLWDELFSAPRPSNLDPTDYVKDNGEAFVNSLRKKKRI